MTENYFGHSGAFWFGTFMMLFRTTRDIVGHFLLLLEPLTVVYMQNGSNLYRAVYNPIAFSQLQSLTSCS